MRGRCKRRGSISIALEVERGDGDRGGGGRRTREKSKEEKKKRKEKKRKEKKRGEAETRLENASQSERECFLRGSAMVKVLVYKQLPLLQLSV